MAKLQVYKETTSKLIHVFIQDSTALAGAGLTGLTYNSSGLSCYYWREGGGSATQVTLVTATLGVWTSGGFKEMDATNMPGWYEIGIPNAALATGADSVVIHLKGATDMIECPVEIQLDTNLFTQIQSDTDDIQSRLPAALVGGRIAADAIAISGSTTAADNVEANIGYLDSSVATVDAIVDSIQTDTNDIQTRLPASLTGDGLMQSDVIRIDGDLDAPGDVVANIGYLDHSVQDVADIVTTIEVDTTSLDGRVPSSLTIDGLMKSDIIRIAGDLTSATDLKNNIANLDVASSTLSTFDPIGDRVLLYQNGLSKNVAFTDLPFPLYEAASGAPLTGAASITVEFSLDGAPFSSTGISNIVEVGLGVYTFDGDAAVVNGTYVSFRCGATDAAPTIFVITTLP